MEHFSKALEGMKRDARLRLEDEWLREEEDAIKAGALAYVARILVQATMPHKKPETSEFERKNGSFVLSMYNRSAIGLPYGRYPRLLMSWVTTEAVRTKNRRLHLGHTLSAFMAELGLIPTGGRWGTITRLRDQMKRLFSTTVSYTHDAPHEGAWRDMGFRVAQDINLWWNPHQPDQVALWGSTVELSEPFFNAVVSRPVPVDVRVLKRLRSPLGIDLYTWLTYRMSYLREPREISWKLLELQFGSEYARTRDFKRKLLGQLELVLKHYPKARVEEGKRGLILRPSPTHIPKRRPRRLIG